MKLKHKIIAALIVPVARRIGRWAVNLVAENISRQANAPDRQLMELLFFLSEKYKIPLELILSKSRKAPVTQLRRVFIHKAIKKGYNEKQIATILNIDRSSVNGHKNSPVEKKFLEEINNKY